MNKDEFIKTVTEVIENDETFIFAYRIDNDYVALQCNGKDSDLLATVSGVAETLCRRAEITPELFAKTFLLGVQARRESENDGQRQAD